MTVLADNLKSLIGIRENKPHPNTCTLLSYLSPACTNETDNCLFKQRNDHQSNCSKLSNIRIPWKYDSFQASLK